MDTKTKLLFLNYNKDEEILKEINKKYETSDIIDLCYTNSNEELLKNVSITSGSIIAFRITNRNEFNDCLGALKKLFRPIKAGFVKPVCITNTKSEKLEKILYKLGCTDVYESNVNSKMLALKVDMWHWTVSQVVNKNEDHLSVQLGSQERLDESIQIGDDFIDNKTEADLNLFLKDNNKSGDELDSSPNFFSYQNEQGETELLNVETGLLDVSFSIDDGNEKNKCILEGYDDDHLTIEIDNKIMVEIGQTARIFIKFVYNKCKIEIELGGNLIEIEEGDSENKQIVINLTKKDVDGFDYFISLFQKRQKSITDFLELAKGS